METLSVYDCKFVYFKGQDNSMAKTLSRYPTSYTPDDHNAQNHAIHPHTNPIDNSFTILNRNTPIPTPLTSIAALTDVNPHLTKIEFSIDDDTVKNFVMATFRIFGALN